MSGIYFYVCLIVSSLPIWCFTAGMVISYCSSPKPFIQSLKSLFFLLLSIGVIPMAYMSLLPHSTYREVMVVFLENHPWCVELMQASRGVDHQFLEAALIDNPAGMEGIETPLLILLLNL
jgi:hypothetical protein